jgi:hypothetical protein
VDASENEAVELGRVAPSFPSKRNVGPDFSLRPAYKPNYQADNHYGAEQSVSKHLLPPVSNELCGVNFYCRSAHQIMSVRYRIVFRIAKSDSRVSGDSSAPPI